MKTMKSFLTLCLSVLISVSMSIGAFAGELQNTYVSVDQYSADGLNFEVYTLVDNDDEKIVQSEDEDKIYTVTYNKNGRTAVMKIQDKSISARSTSSVEIFIDLDNPSESKSMLENGASEYIFSSPISRASISQNTFSNYEYIKQISSPNTWELRRAGDNFFHYYYFQTTETPNNSKHVNSFKNNVDKLNATEIELVFAGGAALLMDALAIMATKSAYATAGALTPAAITAIGGALTANGVFVNKLIQLNTNIRDCYNDYYETLYN